jgi:hypothetical protein
MTNRMLEGSYLLPEPPPARRHSLSGLEPDRRIDRKPFGLKEQGWCSIDVIKPRIDRMSSFDSPGFETALMPFKPWLDLHHQLSGLKPDRKLCWKLFDVEAGKQCPANRHIISTRQKETSLAHLARHHLLDIQFKSIPLAAFNSRVSSLTDGGMGRCLI